MLTVALGQRVDSRIGANFGGPYHDGWCILGEWKEHPIWGNALNPEAVTLNPKPE